MPETKFTAEQLGAIKTSGCDLLVSAAAGSGKTAVLVERIIEIITNGEKSVDIDRLLVVTFTEAAAAEMRQRIQKALNDRMKREPSDENLRRQIVLMNQSSITTIHSFCLRVARRYFHVLEIDPGFRIADTTETALMKAEIMQEIFEERYENFYEKGQNPDFIKLAKAYGGKINDTSLQELALSVFEFSQSNPYPREWLLEQTQKFCVKNLKELVSLPIYAVFSEHIKILLDGAQNSTKRAIKLAANPNIHEGYLFALQDDEDRIMLLKKAVNEGLNKLYEALFFDFTDLSRAKSKTQDGKMTDEEIAARKEEIQALRNDGFKKTITDIRKKVMIKPPEEMLRDIQNSYPYINEICGIVSEFIEKFSEAKRAKNMADFNDLEHFALNILIEKNQAGEYVTSKAANELQRFYHEVMIDEYQDSNMVQELILRAVSKYSQGKKNRFMVGDVKQSIYRFRKANPELFREKYLTYVKWNESEKPATKGGSKTETEDKPANGVNPNDADRPKPDNLLITLSKNFRSRDSVLGGINFIFRQIMSNDLGEVDYNFDSALYYGADYPSACEEDTKTELILIDASASGTDEGDSGYTFEEESVENTDEKSEAEITPEELLKIEVEARLTAQRIKELTDKNNPFSVTEKDGSVRPANYRDVVILVRKTGIFEAFVKELRNFGIPSFAGSRSGYFDTTEIMTVLAFLQIIDNPLQDIHLLTILYSPIYSLSADELVEIRKIRAKVSIYECAAEYATSGVNEELKTKLLAFLAELNKWRDRAVYTPVSELLWSMYNETGYYCYAGAEAGGNIRQANLTALFERAVQYEKTSLKGLFHFIKYIERLRKRQEDAGEAKIFGENEEVVRIMTIHGSKGLEFPLVFVCGMGLRFNTDDTKQNFIMHHKLGFASNYIDLETRLKSNTLYRYAMSRKMVFESLSEEMRILYVALTRAKEKLFLVGTVQNLGKTISGLKWLRNIEDEKLPIYWLTGKTNYLSWILSALVRHSDSENIIPFEDAHAMPDKSRFIITVKTKSDAEFVQTQRVKKNINLLEELRNIDFMADYSGRKTEIEKMLAYEYQNLESCFIPSKLSVSEIKRMYYSEFLKDSETYEKEELPFEKPKFLSDKESASALNKGTVFHTVLEHIDFHAHRTSEGLDTLIDELVSRKILEPENTALIDKNAILSFLNSGLCERMRNAKWIKREARFLIDVSTEFINSNWKTDEKMMVHGIIDCLFEENGKIVVVDYKTDRFLEGGEAAIADKYRIQLLFYKLAAERQTGRQVSETLLYFFSKNKSYVL